MFAIKNKHKADKEQRSIYCKNMFKNDNNNVIGEVDERESEQDEKDSKDEEDKEDKEEEKGNDQKDEKPKSQIS